ncbi:MAG: DNA mismatch repair endonuclease MutL, partial [Lachnospiraceae bacterium]
MSEIQVLDQGTIDKIAAGEVVERPSSIAKELVENALDAGATRVTVEIRDGGIRLLRVTDNGKGIPAEEVRLAFLRHATSKLRTVGDFGTLKTLGFRGEALSSIAAVSRVEMITKRAGELTGTRYCIEGGRERLMEEVGAPEGTTIVVRDIFYNTPARAKFLKTAQTEAAHVGNFIEKLALAKPEVAFEFIANGESKLLTTGNGKLKDVIYQIFGRDAAAELLFVELHEPELEISGVIAKPSVCRSTRNFEMYFVNGRYVKSRILASAIEEGYGTMLMKHMYPFTCLFLDLKGTNVDVNVHPTKMEVRFSDEKGVFTVVKQAVESTLKGQEMIIRSALVKEREAAKKTGRYTNPAPFETGLLRERESAYKATGQSTAAPNTSRSFTEFYGGKNTAARISQEPGTGSRQTERTGIAGTGKNVLNNSTNSKAAGIEGSFPENSENKDLSAGSRELFENSKTGQFSSIAGIVPPDSTNNEGVENVGNVPNAVCNTINSDAIISQGAIQGQPIREESAFTGAAEMAMGQISDAHTGLGGGEPGEQTTSGKTAFAGTDVTSRLSFGEHLGFGGGQPMGQTAAGNTAFAEADAVPGSSSGECSRFGGETAEQTFAEKHLRFGAGTVFEQQELLPGMLSPKARSRRRILGCAFRTYWIIEYGSELFLIDQHAAHEKVLYERLTKMYRDSAVTQQMISPPLIFTATLEEKALLDEYLEAFAEIGFEIEPFGGREYKVSAVPYHLSMLGTRALFTEMLDHLETTRDPKKLSIYILRIA